MVKKYVVWVNWLSAEKRGREDKGLTTQYFYCTTLLDYDPSVWSIRLESIDDNRELFYLIFLFEHYPKIINCDDELVLYDGRNPFAKATIIDIFDRD